MAHAVENSEEFRGNQYKRRRAGHPHLAFLAETEFVKERAPQAEA